MGSDPVENLTINHASMHDKGTPKPHSNGFAIGTTRKHWKRTYLKTEKRLRKIGASLRSRAVRSLSPRNCKNFCLLNF